MPVMLSCDREDDGMSIIDSSSADIEEVDVSDVVARQHD